MSLQEIKSKFDEVAPKLEEAVKKIKEEALKTQQWANIRLYQGDNIQMLISASPTGVVMLRICTRNIKNCIRLTRPQHLEEIEKLLATFGTSKAEEVMKKILSENPTKSNVIDLAVF